VRNLAPVYWHEGLFLRPHHLQQADRYHGDRLGLHMELIDRFHWGVSAIEFERGALRNRAVEIARCAIVFPGGEIALVPENAQIDARSFSDHLTPAGQPIEVYIGLPRIRPNEPNFVDPEGRAAQVARYRVRTREINDEVSGERPATVGFAVSNMKILFGDEDRGAFECVKVAEVVQRGADQFEFSESFAPASLRIDAVPELMRICTRVRDSLSATARALHGMKRERGDVDPRFQIGLVTVNTHAALVGQLVASGNVHPFGFYNVMTSIAGAMSSFSVDAEAWDVQPYMHENPAPAFKDTAKKIEDYLDMAFPRKFIEVRLAWVGGQEWYESGLSEEHFKEGYRYCLAFSSEKTPAEAVRTVVHGKAKVGAPERIPTLRNLALRGVAIKPLDGPPPEIPRRAAAYFHVDPLGPEWDKIKDAKRLSVYLPAQGDLTVSLFVIRS
jgi:type VI secretion system protein ImpJ